jgi:hypothetical protein
VHGNDTRIVIMRKAIIMLFLKAKNIEKPAPRFEKDSTSQVRENLSFGYISQ